MFHIIKDGVIIASSQSYISGDGETIERNFTEDEKNLIEKKYNFIDGEFVKGERALEYEDISKEEEKRKIKEKYQKIIFDKYSLTDQLNLTHEALIITGVTSFEKRDYTEDENERLVEILSAKKWIDEQRKLCSQEIENLSVNP